MAKLKPCPFCGCKDIRVSRDKEAIIERHKAICFNCSAQMYRGTPQKVIEAWNMRCDSGWIGVDEALPDYGKFVIVQNAYNCIYIGARDDRLGELMFRDAGGHYATTAVAWMPIPTLHKGGSEDG